MSYHCKHLMQFVLCHFTTEMSRLLLYMWYISDVAFHGKGIAGWKSWMRFGYFTFQSWCANRSGSPSNSDELLAYSGSQIFGFAVTMGNVLFEKQKWGSLCPLNAFKYHSPIIIYIYISIYIYINIKSEFIARQLFPLVPYSYIWHPSPPIPVSLSSSCRTCVRFGMDHLKFLISLILFLSAEKHIKKRRLAVAPLWWKWGRKSLLYHLLNGHLHVNQRGGDWFCRSYAYLVILCTFVNHLVSG